MKMQTYKKGKVDDPMNKSYLEDNCALFFIQAKFQENYTELSEKTLNESLCVQCRGCTSILWYSDKVNNYFLWKKY